MAKRAGKESRKSKRSVGELDELAIAVATAHHQHGLSHKKIVGQLRREGKDVRDIRDVRFLLKRARDRSLISIIVAPRAAPPQLDEALGGELAEVTRVRKALVVVTDLASDESFRSKDRSQRERGLRESNQLHSILGAATATYLWNTLRDGDRIAIGGGRGAAHTVAGLKRLLTPGNTETHEVMSLSGTRVTPRWALGGDAHGAEADHSTTNLASLLIDGDLDGDNVKLCRLPGFISDRDRDALMNKLASHLSRAPSKPIEADIAVFGGGVVDESHQLMLVRDPQNDEIRVELAQLRRLLDKCRAPVINFCDIFYPGPDVPSRHRRTVNVVVDGLNRKVVTVAPGKLQPVPEKILVAGGRQKLGALEILTREDWDGLRPTTLVTDQVTARKLLA